MCLFLIVYQENLLIVILRNPYFTLQEPKGSNLNLDQVYHDLKE